MGINETQEQQYSGIMADAFLQAGLVSPSEIESLQAKVREKEKVKKAEQEKRLEEQRKHAEFERKEQEIKHAKMLQAFKPFEKLYTEDKSKKFLIHLLFAFLKPEESRIVKNWEKKTKNRRCAICGCGVISIEQGMNTIKDNAADLNAIFVRGIVQGSLDSFKKNAEEVMGYKKVAIQSKESTRFLCMPCYHTFKAWTVDKMMMGDKMLNRIVGQLVGNPFAKKRKKS